MTNLPQSVKLFSVWDGELVLPVPVDAIVDHLSFVQQTQGVRTVLVPLPNPAHRTSVRNLAAITSRRGTPDPTPCTAFTLFMQT